MLSTPLPASKKKPKPMELSCPAGTFAQRSLRGVKWVPVSEQCLVRGPPGPLSSRHPVLSHLRLPWECAGTGTSPPWVQMLAWHQRIRLTAFNQPLKSRFIFFPPLRLQELKQFAPLLSVAFFH